MNILSSFPHPQVITNLYKFLSAAEHNLDILKNVGNQTVDVAIGFHRKEKKQQLCKTIATFNYLLPTFLKIFFFVFRRKKLIQAWNNMRVSK